jgi:outer membrane lipoprotein carrier protein
MKHKLIFLIVLLTVLHPFFASGEPEGPAGQKSDAECETLDMILNQVEKKYMNKGLCTRFVQISTMKVMDISDTATGKLCAKTPGMMRWEYETPDPQLIVTDGESLWMYRPEDNQVMVGKSPVFFEGGKGAGFLSDIKSLRNNFEITLDAAEDPALHMLKLIPLDKKLDIAVLYLYVSKADAVLTRIFTINTYGDETRVDLFDHEFIPELKDDLFTFVIPEGTDIIQIDE